jgi:murein DD-endopeptidase MepM/ murein hydrolase activator NlpD
MVIPPDAFRPIAILAPRTPEPTTVAILSPLSDPKRVSQPTRAPAALAAPEATPPPGPVHVVGAGDTLWEVAARHRVELASILRWNPSVDPRRLVTGQRVPVPGGGPMLTRRSTPRQKPTGQAPPPARLRMRVARQPRGSGEHLWPLPVRGTITNRFSAGHPAIDIAAPLGTSVRAIAAGTVIDAGWRNNGGGNVVVILHPDGMVSTYNHNRDVAVRRGQPVEPGQQIAWVGATGLATGPHLDLRIEMGGRLVNPLVVY